MKNKNEGILFAGICKNNKLTNSKILNNDVGVDCWVSTNNNQIYNNLFIKNNEYQAYDSGINFWDNGYPEGGNYWSDYTGVDLFEGPDQDIPGSDNIGDTPYNIPGGTKKDKYPLVTPDDVPPKVDITKPEKALYILNFKIRSFLIRNPLIIGNINIEVNVTDNESGINRVEFYINDELRETVTEPPYTYTWTKDTFLKRVCNIRHIHSIKIVAYDNGGNENSTCIKVRRFF